MIEKRARKRSVRANICGNLHEAKKINEEEIVCVCSRREWAKAKLNQRTMCVPAHWQRFSSISELFFLARCALMEIS